MYKNKQIVPTRECFKMISNHISIHTYTKCPKNVQAHLGKHQFHSVFFKGGSWEGVNFMKPLRPNGLVKFKYVIMTVHMRLWNTLKSIRTVHTQIKYKCISVDFGRILSKFGEHRRSRKTEVCGREFKADFDFKWFKFLHSVNSSPCVSIYKAGMGWLHIKISKLWIKH
jgi:hypothetical protein